MQISNNVYRGQQIYSIGGHFIGCPVILHRAETGNWCGYAGVDLSSPYFGLDWHDPLLNNLDAEITWSRNYTPCTKQDGFWWLGFVGIPDTVQYDTCKLAWQLLGNEFDKKSFEAAFGAHDKFGCTIAEVKDDNIEET